ncbi:Cys-tRNA(Pro)/Cys-tRNA(Cys) deacylase [Lysinibacillus sp. RC46]|uniref:aminoacyl-tRNA deacylase n=1 Tax=unclassified Lysinibacillus TaxID=2636778 RepID=UPI003519A84F
MNSYENKVKVFLDSNNVKAEHFVFNQSCHSVKEAAEAVNGSEDDFVKNICMIDSNNELIVAIVKGNNRASTTRVAKSLNIEKPRLANGNEIIEHTGFPPGGVPSFGFQAKFLVDPKVTSMDYIYTGGGSENSLVKINVQDLLRINQGTIIKVSK